MEEKKHALLHYGDNIGAPAIKLEDIQGWKTHTVVKANHEFDAKYEEIKREYLKLLDEYEWTHRVYKAAFNFEPIIGETYYLYQREDGTDFLSLIWPQSWKQVHVGSFRFETSRKWIKID